MKDKHQSAEKEILFQLDVLALHMEHGRKVAFYNGFFLAGASFEVFGLTIAVTGLLIERGLPFYWIIMICIYFFTGVGFIAFATLGFGKLKRTEKVWLEQLREKFTSNAMQS
jgi:hypothetical protein